MAFEAFIKVRPNPKAKYQRETKPYVTVNTKSGKLWLNRVICEKQRERGYKFIRLLYDSDAHTIALDFVKHGDILKDWVFNPKPSGQNVSCLTFIRKFDIDRRVQDLGRKRFPAHINNNVVLVHLI